jgi:hypothetical protein
VGDKRHRSPDVEGRLSYQNPKKNGLRKEADET